MVFTRHVNRASIVIVFLLLGTAFGQSEPSASETGTTRAELLKKAKLQKQETTSPLKLGFMEKLFLLGEKGSSGLSPGGIHPVMGSISTGSGPSFGARYGLYDMGGLPLDLTAQGLVSAGKYQDYTFDFGEQSHRATVFTLQPFTRGLTTAFDGGPSRKEPGRTFFIDLDFNRFPEVDFYGIGPHSRATDLSGYLYQSHAVEGVAGIQLNRWLGWSLRGGFVGIDIRRAGGPDQPDVSAIFDPASTPGLGRVAPNFLHFETALLADYRDKPGDAHKGGMFGLVLGRFDDRGGNQFGFNRISAETRQYIPLWSNYRRLALRFLTSFDRPSSGAQVPFYLMESLGGINSIRGFSEYRFRDRNLLLTSAEYRWDAAEFLEFVAFYDAGKVFSRSGDFGFSGLEKGYGGGVRVKTVGSVLIRLELGHSREGNVLHFRLGPSF